MTRSELFSELRVSALLTKITGFSSLEDIAQATCREEALEWQNRMVRWYIAVGSYDVEWCSLVENLCVPPLQTISSNSW